MSDMASSLSLQSTTVFNQLNIFREQPHGDQESSIEVQCQPDTDQRSSELFKLMDSLA